MEHMQSYTLAPQHERRHGTQISVVDRICWRQRRRFRRLACISEFVFVCRYAVAARTLYVELSQCLRHSQESVGILYNVRFRLNMWQIECHIILQTLERNISVTIPNQTVWSNEQKKKLPFSTRLKSHNLCPSRFRWAANIQHVTRSEDVN